MGFSLFGCRFGRYVIYQKWWVPTMVTLSLMLLYGTRHAFLQTVTYLAPKTISSNCSARTKSAGAREQSTQQGTLIWNPGEQNYIFSAYYLGCSATHIPAGALADIHGGKHILSLGLLGSAIITALTPLTMQNTKWHISAIMQLILGCFRGICFPTMISLVANYIPRYQASLLVSYTFSGEAVGYMFASALSKYFIDRYQNWKNIFYIWTSFIIVWYIVCIITVHSRPYSHPFISDEEKCSLAKEFGTTLPKRIPWKDILTDSTVWAMVVAQFGHRFLRFIAYTYLPLFYSEVLCIDIVKDMYKFIIIPAVLQWVFTLIFGYTADYLIRTRYTPVAYARVLFTSLGMTVASIFILVSSYLETNKSAILMCFIVATISRAAVFAGLTANVLDRTRHFTGTVQGLQDGLSTLSGVWFHFLVRYICANNTAAEWRKFFWLTLTVAVSSNTVYFVWGESGRAKWDKVTDEYVSYRHPVPEKNKTESPS